MPSKLLFCLVLLVGASRAWAQDPDVNVVAQQITADVALVGYFYVVDEKTKVVTPGS